MFPKQKFYSINKWLGKQLDCHNFVCNLVVDSVQEQNLLLK